MSKIAVIEDDNLIREMYKLKLERSGYEVCLAENGEIGWQIVSDERPDLILLDLMLPEMNGDVLLQKLRETKWGADIRVVVLTNISKDEAPSSLRLLNVERYIVKAHHTPSQVLEIVNEILGKKASPTSHK